VVTALDPGIPRSAPCEEWRLLHSELILLLTNPASSYSDDQRKIRNTWKARVSTRYLRLPVADLYEWLKSNPVVVLEIFTEIVIWDPEVLVSLRDNFERLSSTICHTMVLGVSSSALDTSFEGSYASINILDAMQRHSIQPSLGGESMNQATPDPHHQIPTLSRILEGIRAGESVSVLSNDCLHLC
jgi:hypothetical protein